MEEFDLDFLKTPPKKNHHSKRADSPFVVNEFDFKLGKKKCDTKRFKMPQTIAKVDELVREIDQLKSQNIQLQQQLRGFQAIAHQVEELYTKEKIEHNTCKSKLDELQKEYHKIDVDLTNMSMLNGQLKARLADYDGRPINFDNLAVQYVKIINKMEGHNIIIHYPDKDLVEKLREYCAAMKLKIPRVVSPKKSKSRKTKANTEEATVQCNLLQENYKTKPEVKDRYTQCSSGKRDEASYNNTRSTQCDLLMEEALNESNCPTFKTIQKVQDQHTQCSTAKRDQASQYISTMITRQTNTEKIVQKNVQTMFPEPASIEDILRVYSKWSNIRSVSPLLSPSRICNTPYKEVTKKFSTTGSCTLLCNIRRRIDYLNLNNSSNIKLETFTPSTSPTPISYHPASRSRTGPNTSNVPSNINSSLLNIFNSTTNSSLEHLSSNAFNELWQIFGKMLLSLLQSNNAGMANTNQNSPLNQQQFLDWLMELYMNSQPQNTPTLQTQTLEQSDVNTSTSPLFFNDTSTLSATVMRPEPQKTLLKENCARTNIKENESTVLSSNSIAHINFNSHTQINNHTTDCDSINRAVQHIQTTSNTNELHSINEKTKSPQSTKNRNEIVEKIQELLPEISLNKKKRKALKRLLQSNNHRKKLFKIRKTKDYNKKLSVISLPNENYNEEGPVETAVDFLKTFAVTQQNIQAVEEHFSETEKIFLKQISNENVPLNVPNILKSEEFAFIKPSRSIAPTQPISKTNEDILKCIESQHSQKIEQKYQLLFGESDYEFGDTEMETHIYKFNNRTVIKNTETLGNAHSNCDPKVFNNSTNDKLDKFVVNSPVYQQQHFSQVTATESTNASVEKTLKEIHHPTLTNTSQEKSLATITPTPIFYNSCNLNSSQEDSITAETTQFSKDLDYTSVAEAFALSNSKDLECFHIDANKPNLNSSAKTNCCSSGANIENSLANDLELSSDCYSDKDDESKDDEYKDKLIKDNGIHNCIKQDNRKSETFEYNEESFKPTTEKCIKSVLNLNEYDESLTNNIPKYIAENRFESPPNVNQDDAVNEKVNAPQIITTSKAIHLNDFEKDFELSSDNESVITENDLNDLHKLYSRSIDQAEEDNDLCEETIHSISSTVSENEKQNTKLIDLLEVYPQNVKHNNFNEILNENRSENPITPEDGIFYDRIGNESFKVINDCERTDVYMVNSSKILNNFPSISLIEIQNDKLPLKGDEENNNKTILKTNSNQQISLEINKAENISESNFKKDSSDNNFTDEINIIQKCESNQTKDNSKNNFEVKRFPSISVTESQAHHHGVSMPKSELLRESFNQSFQNFIETQRLEVKNTMIPKHFVRQNHPKTSKQSKTKSTSKFSTVSLCHDTKSKSINQSNIEENSAAWSVISVSDSTSNDETLNINKIIQTPYEKNDNDNVISKVSDTLQLPGMNKIYNQQLSYNTDQILKDENTISSSYEAEVLKSNAPENMNNILTSEYPNISKTNQKERVIILSCSTITKPSNANNNKNIIGNSVSQHYLTATNNNTAEITPTYISNLYMDQKNNSNIQDTNGTHVINESLDNLKLSNIESCSNISHKSVYTIDESDLNDNLSIENELMIDEELNTDISKQSNTEHLNSILTEFEENCNDTTNTSDISPLLNSTLYNEILTESINPIVSDLLKDELVTPAKTSDIKPKRERKRKSELLAEVQPSKRSQRLKAKQMILEESLHLSKTPIELGKYTKCNKHVNSDIPFKSPPKEVIRKRNFQHENEAIQNSKLHENAVHTPLQLGFFKEREFEEVKTIKSNKKITFTKTEELEAISEFEHSNNSHGAEKTFKRGHWNLLSPENEKKYNKSSIDCEREQDTFNIQSYKMSNEIEIAPHKQTQLDQLKSECPKNRTTNTDLLERENHNSQNDCVPLENFIYSDSPQSPAPTELNNRVTSDTFVIIPPERPSQFMPHDEILTLFDVLIDSYKNENQKQVLKTVSTKELKRNECILNKLCEEIKIYCYTEMELNLYCTSTSLINKLLSTSPDYKLIQKAIIKVAQNAEGTNVAENDFPSIIQEMPPRHLSKCLQRLFIFLKNVVTRNSNFCHELINQIEPLLFSYKQSENLSLQATLNLTQLYLMASKVQEYLQVPKHPARLFIAKCLYFYLQKSSLMIHEVLMWYPTVLPHREDKTYDRSDALISVIQQILMSTKYEMCKPDLRGKVLLSKLRYEYHFEPFKPSAEEVINILIEKLKSSKFYNISLAFGLLCKRMGVIKTQDIVLNQKLIPLANEYYSLALKTTEYDKRVAVLLEVISMLIKPMPIETDIQKYFSNFARFLNGFERQVIQEAALCSLLRLQRFNVEYCYKSLCHFQPTYKLHIHTQAMLKTFLYRRPLTFWKHLKSQNPTNFN